MYFDQQEFDIRCEWGEHGVAVLAPISDVVIIVDVLSFSTAVDIAVHQGATVFPYHWNDQRAEKFAAAIQAVLADPRRTKGKYSLSPESLLHIQPGERIVLPSPNGAALTLAAKPRTVLAGCLRNARSVALAANRYGTRIAVIPAGERWKDDLSLRPSFEDLIGAGAIISHLTGSLSPEAMSAVAAFHEANSELGKHLRQCSSGKELIGRGFSEDVRLASELDSSDSVPIFIEDAFVREGAKDQRG
ncbi:MAG TPA: 2-phosphosulfolactate phosphatase [Anaerolineales bacterium]